ncbi:response regulator [Ramlibacter alkalitolerans]|uniref:Response regulator n=1 Tax=Ramlibacter alkalitolerans TaxID=2039631 RepID=A0ABS1JLD0_9BURK|nr:response regulator [Ramlibacter alkalitolerans]MBL0424726.1 response regulator [Ramlibacter alkalitolerans]
MAQRVFIKVVGFSDEERHALNTVFRLSEQCLTMYQLWTPTAPEPPRVALLDGLSWEARVEAESPLRRDLHLLWVGPNPPAAVSRAFPRPLPWPDVVDALDQLFAPEAELDVDLAQGPDSVMSQKQALIVSASRDQRLYLRARLALARLTLADEAETGAAALELARAKQYDLALLDCNLPDVDAWLLLRQLKQGAHAIQHVAMTQAERTVPERLRAWLGGADALLENPPHPGRLDAWLSRIELGPAS